MDDGETDFVDTLPVFQWEKVLNVEDGITKGNNGAEAVYFVGGGQAEHLGSEGCEDLYLQWQDLNTIAAIRIGPNSLDDDAVGRLSQLLTTNDAILYFSLFTNAITQVGAKAIAEVLQYNKTLVALQLLDSKLTDACVSVIAEELVHSNRSLIQLDLSNNFIKDAGAKSIAKVIRVNDILTTIGLSSNEIGDKGADSLSKALTVNYTVCFLNLKRNVVGEEMMGKCDELLKRNRDSLFETLKYCSENVKTGPLRKAKLCFVGKNMSGKTTMINMLKGKAFVDDYTPTEGATVTQVLTRLRGDIWYGSGRLPDAEFGYQFLSRFVNVKLDEKVATIEKDAQKEDIGFAKFKKQGKRRGSVKERRASIGAKKPVDKNGEDGGRNSASARASRQSRRSSVAQSVLNAFNLDGRRARRGSIKGIINKVAHPFQRAFNDLLEDGDFEFFDVKERKPGEGKPAYSEEKLKEIFDVHVLAKARRERDNLGFNLLELSGNRAYYTIHHAFLTKKAVYVLLFNMTKLANREVPEERLEEIKYINYWLKVIRYTSPNASLMVVGTHSAGLKREYYGQIESDISKLVFPELHKAHAKRKQQMKLTKAVDAANDYAKTLQEEADENSEFVFKKTSLIVNAKDRRLFFPVELSTGKGLENVRLALDEAAQDQEYYGKKIPVRWLKFLDAMRRDSPSFFCVPEKVDALAFQNLENPKVETAQALELFHELGYVAHITEIEQLKDHVITDTLSFYRILSRLIFTEDMMMFDVDEARNIGLGDDIIQTLETGLISEKLLDFILKHEAGMTTEVLNEEQAKKARLFFMEYAQFTLVLSEHKFGGQKNLYCIPSMVPFNHELVVKTKEAFGDGIDLQCKFRFGGYLTLGVFERLLCLCLQFSANQPNSLEPVLTMGWAQISFGAAYTFRLERLPDDILVQVIQSKNKKAYKLVDNFDKMMGRIREILGQGFAWKTTFQKEGDNFIPYEEAKAEKLKGWF